MHGRGGQFAPLHVLDGLEELPQEVLRERLARLELELEELAAGDVLEDEVEAALVDEGRVEAQHVGVTGGFCKRAETSFDTGIARAIGYHGTHHSNTEARLPRRGGFREPEPLRPWFPSRCKLDRSSGSDTQEGQGAVTWAHLTQ